MLSRGTHFEPGRIFRLSSLVFDRADDLDRIIFVFSGVFTFLVDCVSDFSIKVDVAEG